MSDESLSCDRCQYTIAIHHEHIDADIYQAGGVRSCGDNAGFLCASCHWKLLFEELHPLPEEPREQISV